MKFFGIRRGQEEQGDKLFHRLGTQHQNDSAYLRRRFFESFDRSLIEFLANSRSIESHDRIHPIGEGRHFRAFVLLADSQNRIPLVISLPKSSFQTSYANANSKRWSEDMKELRKLRLPLIPPFELLTNGDSLLCLVTPFGSGGSDQALPRWQPLQDYVRMTEQWLRKDHFLIDDMIQIRCFEGIPFICDLSDLIRSKKD